MFEVFNRATLQNIKTQLRTGYSVKNDSQLGQIYLVMLADKPWLKITAQYRRSNASNQPPS